MTLTLELAALDLPSIDLPTGMWVDGAWRQARSHAVTELVTPRDGSVLTALPTATVEDVDDAVAGAQTAFAATWSRMSPRGRGEILLRWADLMERHRDELALLVALEMGKPFTVARDIELSTSIATVRWYGELADKLYDESPRGRHGTHAIVSREPMGVVAILTPWNFPMTLACFKVPAALAAGNSVVLKPASQAPMSMLRAAELAYQAGMPAGVFQVITGSGQVTGDALATHPGIATLTFTGSTAVGRGLLHASGDSNLKPVWLELGGKSPNIIFDDAPDMGTAIKTAAWAIWFNSGQMCTAGSRLLVPRNLQDEIAAGVVDELEALVVGDPLQPDTQMGPLSSARHRRDVADEIRHGIDRGAKLMCGSADIDTTTPGEYLKPAVFVDVDPGSRLAQHEIFGPVLSVIPFDDEEDAIKIANHSDYGLAAAVWTSDVGRVHRVSRALEAGNVWVNCYEDSDGSVPFGGRKLSGHGSDKSEHGLEKYTTLKTTWITW